eukprot:5790551-Pyramimonas_sp.AAC.1
MMDIAGDCGASAADLASFITCGKKQATMNLADAFRASWSLRCRTLETPQDDAGDDEKPQRNTKPACHEL